jgi:hypothetical protein
LSLQFPVAKLLDYEGDWVNLERQANPFAQVVLAHLKARQTRRDPTDRYAWKLRLVRGLYDRGWTADDVRKLFRLVDWIMALPAELQGQFREEVYRFEEEKRMPYLSSFERMAMEEGREKGREEGREEGLREGLLRVMPALLETKFGEAGLALLPRLRTCKSTAKLQRVTDAIPSASAIGDIRRLLR